jgi:hypothetical protein
MDQPPPIPDHEPSEPNSPPEPTQPVESSKPAAPPPPPMSLAARLVNLFAIPGDVFEDVRRSPPCPANWVVPTILFILVSWVCAWLIYSQEPIQQQLRETNDQYLEKLEAKGAITKEQADRNREMTKVTVQVTPYIAPVFAGLLTPFGWGFLIWLLGTKLFNGSFPFMKAVEVAGLASAVSSLEVVIKTLLAVALGNLFASPTPALLLKHFDPQKPSHTLLTIINVMTFWVLAVRAVGLSRLAGVPFPRAGAWTFGLWAVYTSLLYGLGLAVQSLFGM